MTGVVGGIIRDVLVGEVPFVFRKEIYATASFIGASVFLLLEHLGFSIDLAVIVAIIITLLIRVLAIVFNIELPVFISYKAPSTVMEDSVPLPKKAKQKRTKESEKQG